VNDWHFRSDPDDFKYLNKPAHGQGARHAE
jgi:HAE1 family hydrophobic/amphiphilic exporter-1/multidrug efflux pump